MGSIRPQCFETMLPKQIYWQGSTEPCPLFYKPLAKVMALQGANKCHKEVTAMDWGLHFPSHIHSWNWFHTWNKRGFRTICPMTALVATFMKPLHYVP